MVANDLTIYSRYADEWWIAGSPRFRSLQNITPFRLSLISEMVGDVKGKVVADLGCGGGLLSLPLLNAGADVIGVDRSEESIIAAQRAAQNRGTFLKGDVCNLPIADEIADVVLLADVLDHVPHYAKALREAARILKPGGCMFVGTINRTFLAWLFAICLGETLRLIPLGTHDFKLFIKPEELIDAAEQAGLRVQRIQGEFPLVLPTLRKWSISLGRSSSVSVAYSISFRKPIT